MTLGKRLKHIRESKDLYQVEVAEAIGSSKAVISNYERDLRDPDTEILATLASYYNVSVDYLLGLADEPYPIRVDYNTYNKLVEASKAFKDNEIKLHWWLDLPFSDEEKLNKLMDIWKIIN